MKFSLNFWRRSLLVQLVGYFLLISTITATVSGVFSYLMARVSITQSIYAELDAQASTKVDEINRWIDDTRQNLLLIAQSPEIQDQLAALLLIEKTGSAYTTSNVYDFFTRYLIGAITAKPDLDEVFILSDDGKIIFSTTKAHEGQSRALDDYFTEGRKGAYIQNLYSSPDTGKPVITISMPVLTRDNRRLGVLAAHLNLQRMDRIILQQAGRDEQIYVVDAHGNFVSAERFGRAESMLITDTVGIAAVIQGQNFKGQYADFRGVPVVGATRWMPARQMGLLAELDQAVAFAPVNQSVISSVLVGLVTTLLMAVGVWLLARQVVRPILAITSAAQRAAGGDLQSEVPEVTQNEVGTLARTFNQMTRQVRLLYEELKRSEAYFRALIENASDLITVHQADGVITYASAPLERLLGYQPDEVLGQALTAYVHPDDAARAAAIFEAIAATPEATPTAEFRLRHKAGGWRVVEARGRSLVEEGRPLGVILNTRDATEREAHQREQEAIVTIASALRTAQTRSEMFPIILDETLGLLKAEGAALALRDLATNKTIIELGRGQWTKLTGLRIPPGRGVSGQVIVSGRPYVTNDVRADPNQFRADLFGELRAVACVPLIAQDQTVGALWIGRATSVGQSEVRLLTAIADIAASAMHRTSLFEQTEQRLQRLSALRTIDAAITASQDLPATLYTILEQTTVHLKVDATAILLFKRFSQTLEYAASRGFYTNLITSTRLRLGESHAGHAAAERRLVRVIDVADLSKDAARAALVGAENFVSYYGVPLISKGQLKGVLEIFNRTVLTPDPEWEAFLEALGGEAVIAIDNASMFEELQHANVDLAQAYDATIEGWARTLEIRDRTPGHTQRVLDLSVGLARALGVSDADLVHLRRGAILHDVGKMSMPDSILTKPEPLTGDDLEIMRHHPENAYKMLASIPYLRPALDIPYCHHERWDGSGYPRGLVAEQIPLSARVFAVVDMWDELRYRRSLPEDQVRDRLQTLAGFHFDPDIVDVFLKLEII